MGYMTSQYRKVAPARIEQRDAVRHPVFLKAATARLGSSTLQEARLVDLSIYGCRLMTDANFKIGQRLSLRFAGGKPVSATAIWLEGERLGCRFDAPLDRALFRALILQSN